MYKSEKVGVSERIAALLEVFDVSEDKFAKKLQAYTLVLLEEDQAIVTEGIRLAMTTCRKLPTVAEILDLGRKAFIENGWMSFKNRFEKGLPRDYDRPDVGIPANAIFDPEVYTVVQSIGLDRIRTTTEQNWHWVLRDAKEKWLLIQSGQLGVRIDPKLCEQKQQESESMLLLLTESNLSNGKKITMQEKFTASSMKALAEGRSTMLAINDPEGATTAYNILSAEVEKIQKKKLKEAA